MNAEGAAPDRAALTILAGVWADARSGWLCLAVDDSRAPICQGGVLSGEGLDVVDRALVEGNVWFEDEAQTGLPDDFSVGLALWEAALRCVDEGLGEPEVVDKVVRLNGRSRACRRLPVPKAVKRLLNARPRTRPVRVHLVSLGLERADVERELQALCLLELVELRHMRRRGDTDPTSLGSESSGSAPSASLRPGGSSREPGVARRAELEKVLAISRLHTEAERLESADDWTVLGVPSGSGRERIEAAAERMRDRYLREVERPRGGPDGVEPARKLLAREERAAANLLSGRDPIVEEAYRRGGEAAATGAWAEAVTCFRVAREREPQAPRALAWLGWAIYNDEGRPTEKRRAEGGDLIRLAATFPADDVPELQWFLAQLDAHSGATDEAAARLAKVLRNNPGLPGGARKLYLALRRG